MSLQLFFTDPSCVDLNSGSLWLTGNDFRHLSRVLRAKPGEKLLVSDGERYLYTVELVSSSREEAHCRILGSAERRKMAPSITVYQAVGRISKLDETVDRLAEAGADRVVPFVSPRSPVGSSEKLESRYERLCRIAVEASKVARRPVPLVVGPPVKWPLSDDLLAENSLNLVLWEEEESVSLCSPLPGSPPSSIGVIVGPEGGFSTEEIEALSASGVLSVSLGPLILRTESAAAYSAFLIRSLYGQLNPGGMFDG